jgi:hypothetical protein
MAEVVVNILIQNAIQNSPAETSGFSAFVSGISSIIGTLANWIQVAQFVVQLLQAAEGEDSSALLSEIAANVQALVDNQGGNYAGLSMAIGLQKVTQAQLDLGVLLNAGNNWKTNPLVNESVFLQQDAGPAAYQYANDIYWMRPYVADFTFSDTWLPNNGQPKLGQISGAPFVFDPQLSLPTFIFAINCLVQEAVIFFAGTTTPQLAQSYFADLANYLQTRYDEMVSGIQTVPIPTFNDLQQLLPKFGPSAGNSEWFVIAYRDGMSLPDEHFFYPFGFSGQWRGEVGAVDTYAVFGQFGYSNPVVNHFYVETANAGAVIGIYPTLIELLEQCGYGPSDIQASPFPWFGVRMEMGNLARFKALYVAKGLDQVWLLIQKLRFLSAGQKGYETPPAPAPEVSDLNAHWSLASLDMLLGKWALLSAVDGGQGGYYSFDYAQNTAEGKPTYVSVEDIFLRLQMCIDNATNFPTGPPPDPFGPDPYVFRPYSLRSVIQNVAV